jgi:hypothetical protein
MYTSSLSVQVSAAKFKPFIFSVSGFAVSYAANTAIIMIWYALCLLSSQFCYIIVYIRKVESLVHIADQCAPWKIFNGAENLVFQAL